MMKNNFKAFINLSYLLFFLNYTFTKVESV